MPRGLQLPYTEFRPADAETCSEQFDASSGSAVRVLDVAWDDRIDAMRQLLGYPEYNFEDPAAPYITRYLPDVYADLPEMIATKVSSKGLAARGYNDRPDGRIAKYERARLTVTYELVPYDVLDDETATTETMRYVIPELKPAAEYLSVPQTGSQGLLIWSEGPGAGVTPFPGNVGYIVGNIDYKWTWLQIPYEALPLTAINRTIGRVNSKTFELAELVAPPGTLLLMAADVKRQNSPTGTRLWQVEYTARYNPRLHNNFYNFRGEADTGANKGWYQASTTGVYFDPADGDDDNPPPNGVLLYDNEDFYKLFKPDPLV